LPSMSKTSSPSFVAFGGGRTISTIVQGMGDGILRKKRRRAGELGGGKREIS